MRDYRFVILKSKIGRERREREREKEGAFDENNKPLTVVFEPCVATDHSNQRL